MSLICERSLQEKKATIFPTQNNTLEAKIENFKPPKIHRPNRAKTMKQVTITYKGFTAWNGHVTR